MLLLLLLWLPPCGLTSSALPPPAPRLKPQAEPQAASGAADVPIDATALSPSAFGGPVGGTASFQKGKQVRLASRPWGPGVPNLLALRRHGVTRCRGEMVIQLLPGSRLAASNRDSMRSAQPDMPSSACVHSCRWKQCYNSCSG